MGSRLGARQRGGTSVVPGNGGAAGAALAAALAAAAAALAEAAARLDLRLRPPLQAHAERAEQLRGGRGAKLLRYEQPRRQGLQRAARGSRSRVVVSHVVVGVVLRRHAQLGEQPEERRDVGQRHCALELHVPRASRRSAAEPPSPPATEKSSPRARLLFSVAEDCSRAVERRVDGLERGDVHLERHRQREQRAEAHLGLARRESSARRAAMGSRTPSSCSPTAARPAAARPVDARPADLSEAQQLELAAPSPA
eukprot:scaffold8263_cov67-Phaeocystis_antarctica.AAC.3